MQADLILTNQATFHNSLSLSDLTAFLDLGPLSGGYRLVKHPGLIGYGIANEAGQVAFWDSANKPFNTIGDVNRWLESRPAAPDTRPIKPIVLDKAAAFDAAFIDGGVEPTSRRDFLKQAAGLFGLAITAPLLLPVAAAEVLPPWGNDEHPLDRYHRLKALGEAIDPARAALIDEWCERMEALSTLAYDLAYALDDTRSIRAVDVDPMPTVRAMDKLQQFVSDLACDFEEMPSAHMLEVVTGRYEAAAWVETEMRRTDGAWAGWPDEGDRWLLEIEDITEHHPEERARLFAVHAERFGGRS
jgi:hypothetical protein